MFQVIFQVSKTNFLLTYSFKKKKYEIENNSLKNVINKTITKQIFNLKIVG